MATTTLRITGMTCGHCVRSVSEALGQLPGVQSADVLLDRGQATVVYDDTQVTSRDLVGAVMSEGYTAEDLSA